MPRKLPFFFDYYIYDFLFGEKGKTTFKIKFSKVIFENNSLFIFYNDSNFISILLTLILYYVVNGKMKDFSTFFDVLEGHFLFLANVGQIFQRKDVW